MSDRALSRTPSQPSALLAKLTKPRSRAEAIWVPRFIYPATRDFPRIVVAALEAEAFPTWPVLRRFSGTRA